MPVPSSFTLSLHSLDGLGDINSLETEIETTGNFVKLYIVLGLPANRFWGYTIMAYGCQQHNITVLGGTTISKLVFEIYLHDLCAHLTNTILNY